MWCLVLGPKEVNQVTARSRVVKRNLCSNLCSAPFDGGAGVQGGAPAAQRAVALYPFQASRADELSLQPGDVIDVLQQLDESWWLGSSRGETGVFPATFVEPMRADALSQQQGQLQGQLHGRAFHWGATQPAGHLI